MLPDFIIKPLRLVIPIAVQVVDKDSAVLDSAYSENIPVARDHEHLVRFGNAEDDAYNTMCQTLKRKVAQILDWSAKSAKESKFHAVKANET